MADENKKTDYLRFTKDNLDGSTSVYRPGWKSGPKEPDEQEGRHLLAMDDEWHPTDLGIAYESDEWTGGVNFELSSYKQALADDLEHQLWVTMTVNIPWREVEQLRDTLTLMLALYR